MNTRNKLWLVGYILFATCILFSGLACSTATTDNKDGGVLDGGNPKQGEVGGPCYGNDTCNVDLKCVAGYCVEDEIVIKLVNKIETPDYFGSGVVVEGNYLYVGDRAYPGIRIFDITDPQNPNLVKSYKTANQVNAIDVINKVVYASYFFLDEKDESYGGVFIVDFRNMDNPNILGAYQEKNFGDKDYFKELSLLYAIGPAGLHILDIGDPTNISSAAIDANIEGESFIKKGDYLYVASGEFNGDMLNIYNIKDINNIVKAGDIKANNRLHIIRSTGKFIYTAGTYDHGIIKIYDASNGDSLKLLGEVDSGFYVGDILENNKRLFVLDSWSGGLKIADINNPESPKIIASWKGDVEMQKMAISGEYLYTVGPGSSSIGVFSYK